MTTVQMRLTPQSFVIGFLTGCLTVSQVFQSTEVLTSFDQSNLSNDAFGTNMSSSSSSSLSSSPNHTSIRILPTIHGPDGHSNVSSFHLGESMTVSSSSTNTNKQVLAGSSKNKPSSRNGEDSHNGSVTFQNQHPLCKRLVLNNSTSNSVVLNAGNIWMGYWEDILQASLFPSPTDVDVGMENIYRNVLLDISPSMWESSLVSMPDMEQIDRVWNILESRRKDPTTNPPLLILVMGGSVTEGVRCEQSDTVRGRNCNWSVRLQSFINTILGYDAVHIINIAQGGTDTRQALSIIKYWIYPPQLGGGGTTPDIIIHAFGSNDSHLGPGVRSEQDRIQELFQKAVESLNDFTQSVQRSHPCPTPIVVHLDDYFGGHRQGSLLGDFTYRMVLKEVARWYNNMAVSSAHVVGPLVYPDTLGEGSLSPHWHIMKHGRKNKGRYNENVHFGWIGHQAIVWCWAYSTLKVMVSFCDHLDWEHQRRGRIDGMGEDRKSHTVPSVHDLQGVAPPPLNYSLRLEDISDEWKREKVRQVEHCEQTSEHPPCVMAWIAGPEGPTSDIPRLSNYLQPYVGTLPSGWAFEKDMSHGWARRLGIVAKAPNGTIVFQFPKIAVPLTTLTIHSLKSYGDSWQGSEALFTVTSSSSSSTTPSSVRMDQSQGATLTGREDDGWTNVAHVSVTGTHNSTSSITYSTELVFTETIQPGSNVRLEVTLIGGTTFKITGMMLCSR